MADSSFAPFRFTRIGIVCVGAQCLARIGHCPADKTTGGRARAATGRTTPSPGGVGHDVKSLASNPGSGPADQAQWPSIQTQPPDGCCIQRPGTQAVWPGGGGT